MHREIRSIDRPFAMESHALLYLFTACLGLLVALDLWPNLASWLNNTFQLSLPYTSYAPSLYGVPMRFAMWAAVLGCARAAFTSLESLLAGRLGADLAIALAVLGAILLNQPLVGAEVVLIGLIGECLEAVTFNRTQNAVRKLAETFPRMCLVWREGKEVMVPIDQISIGEQVTILPGKRVPVDGVIVEGRSAIDQSNLTGESIPVDKEPGDEVLAGTVNQFGALKVEVKGVGEQTLMGQVIATTAKALSEKGPRERTADRLARYFLPVVLGIALVTFLAHWWWLRGSQAGIYQAVVPALAVLVVACPCALILATPAATIAALGRLAKTGVLVKRVAALERLASVKRVIFDKTGTLTTAQLSLGSIVAVAAGSDETRLLQLAASVEAKSEHPIAAAILQAARQRQIELLPVDAFTALPGAGIQAQVEGKVVRIGTMPFLRSGGVKLPGHIDTTLQQMDAQGQTALLIAADAELLGVVGVWDTIRPEAAAVLNELRSLGVELTLLSGDRAGAVQSIAQRLELNDVRSECLPTDKAKIVREQKGTGATVAMVGDGVNDAPALAEADVGLALGGVGSDIAAEAGDIVLMGDPLSPLPMLVRLSREMVTIIRQNILWFAFGVNIVGIVLTGWIMPAWSDEGRAQSPIWAAFYHQIASLAVLLNAMRLLWFERTGSPIWQRTMAGYGAFDQWLERVNWHDASHWVMDRARYLVPAAGCVLLLLYLSTSLNVVPAGSVGIVQRCGRALDENLQPGLHVRLPWPFETVRIIEPDLVRRVEVGFRRASNQSDLQTWTSSHSDNLLQDREEGLLITADGNLVEVQATVLYTVADTRKYLFRASDIESLLRGEAESALREIAAQRSFPQLLGGDRAAFQRDILQMLQQRLLRIEPYLGVRVGALLLEDLHPPQEVVKDYYEVTRALAARSRVITEAFVDGEKNVSRETVNSTRIRAEAQGDAAGKVTRSEADRDAFLDLTIAERWGNVLLFSPPPLSGSPWTHLPPLLPFLQAHDSELTTGLTLFRLTVEAGEQLLSQRPKVLRDPKIKGPLHVYPESLKLRLPTFGVGRERPPPNPELP